MNYQTKPKQVKAVEVTKDMKQIEDFPEWAFPYLEQNGSVIRSITNIGPLSIFEGDYLVLHGKGDIFPYSAEHFHKNFEKVDSDE